MFKPIPILIVCVSMFACVGVSAQNWGPNRDFPPGPKLSQFPGDRFTFCTVVYNPNGMDEALGFGWSTDWPDAGSNFMRRLAELTTIDISRDASGEPHQEIIRLTDPALFNYPFIFMSDVGTAGFSDREAQCLRKYLLSGGFLMADDFWGDAAARKQSRAEGAQRFPPAGGRAAEYAALLPGYHQFQSSVSSVSP